MVAELLSRCSDFQAGREIRLADDQPWIFPAPAENASFAVEDDADYRGLIRAIREAENRSERLMAELALALFLFRQNYRVSPAELEFLFTFPPESRELASSQHAFGMLAQDHLHALYGQEIPSLAASVVNEPWQAGWPGLLGWLRSFWPIRGWFVNSRKSGAMP